MSLPDVLVLLFACGLGAYYLGRIFAMIENDEEDADATDQ